MSRYTTDDFFNHRHVEDTLQFVGDLLRGGVDMNKESMPKLLSSIESKMYDSDIDNYNFYICDFLQDLLEAEALPDGVNYDDVETLQYIIEETMDNFDRCLGMFGDLAGVNKINAANQGRLKFIELIKTFL